MNVMKKIRAAYLAFQWVQRRRNARPWFTEQIAVWRAHEDEAALLEAIHGPADENGVYGGPGASSR